MNNDWVLENIFSTFQSNDFLKRAVMNEYLKGDLFYKQKSKGQDIEIQERGTYYQKNIHTNSFKLKEL